MRAAVLAAAIAVAVLAVVVAPDRPIEARVVRAPGVYVALGDSYSAGAGVTPGLAAADQSCARSQRGFPMLLPGHVVADRAVVACAGATIADVLGPDATSSTPTHAGAAPQLDALDTNVDLVTLTVGGNDLDFAPALRFCVTHLECARDPYGGAPSLDAWVTQTLPAIRADLAVLYARLRDAAPLARIVVLGYPALFAQGELASDRTLSCDLVALAFDASEREAIRAWGAALNATIRSEAEAAGLTFLPLDEVFRGHEACAGPDAWIEPVVFDPDLASGSFHPNAEGHAAIAATIQAAYGA